MSNSTIQRRREIMDYLQDENFCSINTLIEHFNVAPATLRRDMTILEKDGLVQRTHGSVWSLPPPFRIFPSVGPSTLRKKAAFPAAPQSWCMTATLFCLTAAPPPSAYCRTSENGRTSHLLPIPLQLSACAHQPSPTSPFSAGSWTPPT